ncbi:MAG TPA: archaetidylserine decarboxylase [Polyangia bacterium]|nr:archaetidylserine decarboxylase [Polyangia bacterium]
MSFRSPFQSLRSIVARIGQNDQLTFLLTNQLIPRRLATRLVGRISKVRQPLVRDLSIGLWRLFADPDLDEAAKASFDSLHDCFIRELKPGARAVDPDPAVLTSPCDAIVNACGAVQGTQLIQAKGISYTLDELLDDPALVERYRDGRYVTLRLTSSMYHRFHAPYDLRVTRVNYISGDTLNTNPSTVKRVDKLYCKNERAVVQTVTNAGGHLITLVPVASILVASIRLRFLDVPLHLAYDGPRAIDCDARFGKGDEMGWFELGSTIIVFAPAGFELCEGIRETSVIRMGQPLLKLP